MKFVGFMVSNMNTIVPESSEVYYPANPDVVVVDSNMVEKLIALAAEEPRQRCRLCLHAGVDNTLHEMVIVHKKSAYVRPHRHLGKSESFHVIQGEMLVVLFNDDGEVREAIHLGEPGRNESFCYRLGAELYHSVIPLTDWVVFHEVTNGPFRREDMVMAEWAPSESDNEQGSAYVQGLLGKTLK